MNAVTKKAKKIVLPFVKNLALSAVSEIVKVEPTFANELIGWLETNAGPALSTYVTNKAAPAVAASLANIEAKLNALIVPPAAAPAPASPPGVPPNVVPLPGAAAPAASGSVGGSVPMTAAAPAAPAPSSVYNR